MHNQYRFAFFSACILFSLSLFSCATNLAEMYYGPPSMVGGIPNSITLADHTTTDVNGMMPDAIVMKTPTQTFCRRYGFTLVDGRIYYKLQDGKGKKARWKLLTGTGLPHSGIPGFKAPQRIVEISADDDTLFALSNEGRMYQCYFDRTTITKPLTWIDTFGWPSKLPLILNDLVLDNRGWSVGTRRKSVLWYEDINGNQHHYGTMGIETIYFLAKDGQEIRYADTGLPPDFSHGVLGPERGKFIARALSASASTIFVINAAGEMYTRLADFDTLGNDPMFFKYTYHRSSYPIPGSDYRSNFTPWALPSEDWKKEPAIPLSGKARISSCITILQTGQGNFARELRVAGVSPEGKDGYYFKKISDAEWSFKNSPIHPSASEFLDTQDIDKEKLRGAKKEFAYAGSLWNDGARDGRFSLGIPDFPLAEGSCHLTIKYKDEERTIDLFPVEIWNYLQRYNPGLDGMPKYFFVTISAPDTITKNASPEFARMLDSLFLSRNLELFSCRAEVTDSYFELSFAASGSDDDGASGTNIFLTRVGIPEIDFKLLKKAGAREDPLARKYLDENMLITDVGNISIRRRTEIENIIARNEQYRDLVQKEIRRYQTYRSVSGLSRLGYKVFDIVTTVTMLDKLEFPKFKTATSYSGNIMATNAEGYSLIAESREWIYAKLLELIDRRIAEYEKIITEFDSGELKATLDPSLRNTFPEYFSLIGMPERIDGSEPSGSPGSASVQRLDTSPLFPGLVFEAGETRVLVELEDSVDAIMSRNGARLSKKPFRVDVVFHVVTGTMKAKSGNIEWNGSCLKLWENTSFFSKKLVFTGYYDR